MPGEKRFSYLHLLFLLPVAGLSMALGLPYAKKEPASPPFSFIRTDLNVIDNNLRGMKSFYEQLSRLEKGEVNTVRVVHIGDSHIQADGFSGKVRLSFHQQFGARGRGLIFPYNVAKTTSPPDLRAYSSASWMARRNITRDGPLPYGISGITMRTTEDYSLNLSVTGNDRGINYEFDQVTVFSEKGPQNFALSAVVQEAKPTQQMGITRSPTSHTVAFGETLSIIASQYGCTVKELQEWNELTDEGIYAGENLEIRSVKTPAMPVASLRKRTYPFRDNRYSHFSSSILIDYPVSSMVLEGKRAYPQQVQSMLYGIVLENTRNHGVLYHMIGVNGAQYEHFNASAHFIEQLSELTPDLIIISLGTNEIVNPAFSPGKFYRQVDQLILAIKQNMPHASILITTPPDNYVQSTSVNPNGARAKSLLANYSMNNDLACWNLYDIMGGEGAVDLWYRNGLAQNDRIHFTSKGYSLQGDLLFEALMNGYGTFKSYRTH